MAKTDGQWQGVGQGRSQGRLNQYIKPDLMRVESKREVGTVPTAPQILKFLS